MGIFNEHSTSQTYSPSGVGGSELPRPAGPRGPPGIGFTLTQDGNCDLENKKLTNVQNGDGNNDVMVKSQIEGYVSNKTKHLDGALPAQDLNNKGSFTTLQEAYIAKVTI